MDPRAQRSPLLGTIRGPLLADGNQRSLGSLDAWVDASQREHLRRRSQFRRVAAVERSRAQRHAHLLHQISEVARHQCDEERCARDRTIDPRDVRGVRSQILGDLGRMGVGARASC